VPVRAASRDVRDSASSLEAGQLSAHAGSGDSKRPPREDTVDDASEETKRNESFAAKKNASARRDASALNGTHTRRYTTRFSRGTPVVPVTDDDVACLSTDGDRRTATETRASERSSTSLESLESGTDEAFLGSANDASDDDERGSIDRHDRHDRSDRSDTDATSVLFMSTFDGTEAKTRSPEESPEKSPDALLRETRALLNRSAPGRFGAESRFPRESNTEADDAATGRERIDTREKQGKQGSVRVPVLEAYDEAHARRKKTRGGEPSLDALRRARLAFSIPKTETASAATRRTSNDARTAETSRRSSARESAETKAHTKPSQLSPCVRGADGAKGAQGAQGARPPFRDVRQSATDFAKTKAASPSPRRGALAAPFERVRRRSAERAARASRSGTSFASPCHESHAAASKTLLDGATRRRLAEATATLARVEASRREKFSAAHPARASSSRGQTVSASADRARRSGDVLAEYRSVRGSSTIETAPHGNDAHRPTEPRFRVSDENAENAENAKHGTSLSSRARFFARGTSNFRTIRTIATSYGSIERHGHEDLEEHEDLEDLEDLEDTTLNATVTMPFVSPTVRATPLTSGAPKRVVAPMSEKMRRARGALRALQIPGAEPAAPRRARVAAQAERVSSAATFVATQRVSAPSAAACAARPASHLVGHRDRYG
jgi:hypothetical protein